MIIDSHCHLISENAVKDAETQVFEANAAGVTKLINIGTSIRDNATGLSLVARFPDVYTSVGIYPHEQKGQSLVDLRKLLILQIQTSQKVVAIGECGLDLVEESYASPLGEQIPLFEMQIETALENNLPIVVHNRNGDSQILPILDKYTSQGLRGVIHCFDSDVDMAKKYIDRGFYISFSGMLTYKNRERLREVARYVPNDRFLVETDSPYLSPEGFRKYPNEPRNVVEVVKKISELKNLPFEKCANLSYSSTCTLFNIC